MPAKTRIRQCHGIMAATLQNVIEQNLDVEIVDEETGQRTYGDLSYNKETELYAVGADTFMLSNVWRIEIRSITVEIYL